MERLLTLNIRKYLVEQPRTKRIKKAAKYVRERVAHYTKTDYDKVRITQELNNRIVKHYAKRMTPLKLSVSIDNGVATVKAFTEERAKAHAPEQKEKAANKAVKEKKEDRKAKEAKEAPTKK